MFTRTLKLLVEAFKQTRTPAGLRPEVSPRFDVVAVAQTFLKNSSQMRQLQSKNDKLYVSFLQPYVGSAASNRQSSRFESMAQRVMLSRVDADNRNELKLLDALYDQILLEKSPWIVDLRDIFDLEKDEIYFDQVHLSDRGNGIIANRMADHLMEFINSHGGR